MRRTWNPVSPGVVVHVEVTPQSLKVKEKTPVSDSDTEDGEATVAG